MIHYSCDRCKRSIDPQEEIRYVIRLDVRAAMEVPEIFDDEDDRDYLMEAHELLERVDDGIGDLVSEDVCLQRRFDLCPSCYRKFIKNPMGRDVPAELNYFSKN